MAEMFESAPDTAERNWKAIIAGLVAVAIAVGILVFALRSRSSSEGGPSDPNAPSVAASYATHLPLSDVRMSTASIGTGGQLYYITGTVTNDGDQRVTGATVELVFRDSMGQICQRDREPLRVIVATEPAVDVADLSRAPLAPKQARAFQISVEHISAQWDGQYPTLTIVRVNN